MKLHYLLPVLAAVGFSFASYSVVSSNQPIPVSPAVVEPPAPPFQSFIAGSGITEPKSRNIEIGTPLSRLVNRVNVKVGDKVVAGTPLFYLDDRDTVSELMMRKTELLKAQTLLEVANTELANVQSLNQLAQNLSDKRAISGEELLKRKNAVAIAISQVEQAKASVIQAQASVNNSQINVERLIVRAPISGEILQVNIRPGEFANSGANTPLLLMGNLDDFHVRVDIDENDAWRFEKNRKAVAFLRGNRNFSVDLELAYVEPFVVPKRSLTGDSIERVDTRVLQALYRFKSKDLPIYIGQQMDVFIEARPITGQ